MVTGHVPFERDEEAKVWAHLAEPPPRPSRLRPELPVALDAVVERALAKDPDARQPSAGDLGRAARAACAGRMPAEPERMVARGAASPAGAPREPGLAEEVPTLTRPPPVSAGGRGGRRRALALGAGGRARRVGGHRRRRSPSAARGIPRPRPTSGRRPARPRHRRRSRPPPPPSSAPAFASAGWCGTWSRVPTASPTGAAISGWSGREEARVARIRAATGRERRRHPYVGRGTLDIAAGPSGVYVAVSALGRIMRLDPRSGPPAGADPDAAASRRPGARRARLLGGRPRGRRPPRLAVPLHGGRAAAPIASGAGRGHGHRARWRRAVGRHAAPASRVAPRSAHGPARAVGPARHGRLRRDLSRRLGLGDACAAPTPSPRRRALARGRPERDGAGARPGC